MTVDERIAKYTLPEPNSGCWLWTGAMNGFYPRMTIDRKAVYVHRYVCEQAHGLPDGLNALHKCDVPLCVNPDHLYPGTQKQNLIDAYARGRMPSKSGENSKLNKLTWADVAEIRASDASNSQLAARYGVARSRISDIRTLKSWRQHG
jgi:hypothetical protein